MLKKPASIDVWWHAIAALPPSRENHAYHALRRVWGDHTISGPRSFYKIGTEDNLTPALFQNWAVFPDSMWVAPFLSLLGCDIGHVKRVRWAYACEEELDERRRRYHGRNFVTPDIILHFEDEKGLGLVAFEVKKPGGVPDNKDVVKLESYCNLPSTRRIGRRYGCFLVSETKKDLAQKIGDSTFPVITWEEMGKKQVAAVRELALPSIICDLLQRWIIREFSRNEIWISEYEAPPDPMGSNYGLEEAYRQIDRMALPDSVRLFLKGSEAVEAVWSNLIPDPPMPWLRTEPNMTIIQAKKWQSTPARRVCRWSFDWDVSQERVWG